MPLPLKPGYHFNFDHTARSPHYEMAAVEAGFSSNAYFSDCFRRNTGISPIQFRRENGNV